MNGENLLEKEQIRQELIERYLSTGKVGFTRSKDDMEALDLIETVVELYKPAPTNMSLTEISQKLKDVLDF